MANSERAIDAMKGTAKQIIPFDKLARAGKTITAVGRRGTKAIGKRGR